MAGSVARKVTLHGELGKLFGREHRLAVNSPREAVKALVANRGDAVYRYFLQAQDKGIGFVVLVDGVPVDEIGAGAPSGIASIEIAPVIHGAGGSWWEILVGVILIIAGGVLMYFGRWEWGAALMGMGVGMIMGPTDYLSPGQAPGTALTPRTIDAGERHTEDLTSYAFAGPVNTVQPGQCIPVIFGEVLAGSRMVSFGIWNKLMKDQHEYIGDEHPWPEEEEDPGYHHDS
jgi:predicted phage tail protein